MEMIGRREFVIGATAAAVLTSVPSLPAEAKAMYGLIARMNIAAGKRDELIAILIEGTAAMPGCFCYVVAKDTKDENSIWITEVWDSKESHDASLQLPEVKAAITKGRPMITGVDTNVVTKPIGGFGLGTVSEPAKQSAP